MDFFFAIDEPTDEEQAAREEENRAYREAERLREEKEMEKWRRQKAAEERWYPKEQRVLSLEDCFKQNAVVLPKDDKQEFEEFIPKITSMFEKDVDMMKMMGEIKDEKDLEAFLTNWYTNLKLGVDDKDHLDEFLTKFEKQVFAALRLKAAIPAVSSSQMHYDFFMNLKEAVFHKEMRQIRASDISQKLMEKEQVAMETKKTSESLNKADFGNQLIEKPKKRGRSSAQLKINSPEPKRKQKEDDSWLDEVIEIFPGPQAAVADDDDDDDIIEIFPDRQ